MAWIVSALGDIAVRRGFFLIESGVKDLISETLSDFITYSGSPMSES